MFDYARFSISQWLQWQNHPIDNFLTLNNFTMIWFKFNFRFYRLLPGVLGALFGVSALLGTAIKAAPTSAAGSGESDALLRSIPQSFDRAAAQYSRLLDQSKNEPLIPRTWSNGAPKAVPPKDWTSGFFAGSLWYLYEYTRDSRWLAAAKDYTARLECIKDYSGSHDVGFMLGCSYGNGYRLTQDPEYQKVMQQGAATLATRYNAKVGALRSWDHGDWNYPVIIDNMMNLEFLMTVARKEADGRLREIAISHADKTLQNQFRADFSSFHVVDYNPENGEVIARKTHQGAADNSAWARGQAWALYGFTMMYRETGRPNYLAQAKHVAAYLINHPQMPSDKIPYWDYDAPHIPNAPRDASAAAIMSSALIELSSLVGGDLGMQYLALARQQLVSLSSPAYFAKPGDNGNFVLMHSVGNLPAKSEVDVPLNYADYYYLEALLRYRLRMSVADLKAVKPPFEVFMPRTPSTKEITADVPAADAKVAEETPLNLPGSEPFIYRKVGEIEMRLHCVKPKGWTASDRRACFISFFGGGWSSGSPVKSIGWAKWAAGQGLVGIAPDYRTRLRFEGTPEDCVSDARAAVAWVVAHAAELGIDPKKIIVEGGSAGGHVAAWTAIPSAGPGKDSPAMNMQPAALVLLNPVTDTTASGYGGPKRFSNDTARATACSVPAQMPAKMPPAIVFHATGDTTVDYANSVAFKDKLVSQGNRCELVTFEGLGHSYNSSKFGEAGKAADKKTREDVATFLVSLGLMGR